MVFRQILIHCDLFAFFVGALGVMLLAILCMLGMPKGEAKENG